MDTTKKVSRFSLRRIFILGGLAAFVILIAWAGLSHKFAGTTNIGNCSAPEGYTFISNVMAKDLNDNPVFVARAVVSMGEVTTGGSQYYIPSCGSSDEALQNVSNMFVNIDGKLGFIANGAVGLTSPLAQAPQP